MSTLIKEKIIKNEVKLLLGIKDNNIKVLEELLHEDLLFNLPNGKTITKEMEIEPHRLGELKMKDIWASEQNINLIGEDTAIVAMTVKIKSIKTPEMPEPADKKIRQIRVWKKFDDEWKVIAGSSTLLE